MRLTLGFWHLVLISLVVAGCATPVGPPVAALVEQKIELMVTQQALEATQLENQQLRRNLWLIMQKGWGQCI